MTAYLLLAGGGAERIAISDEPVTIGRARTSDLVVRDPSVSRRHLHARATSDGIELTVETGCAPIVHRGRAVDRAVVAIGDHVIVGTTILTVAASGEGHAIRSELDTEAGIDADVRGLSAVIALLDDLDAAPDVATAVQRWARATLGAIAVSLDERGQLGVVGRTLAVAAGSRRLVLELPGEPDRTTRGIVAVAGSVIAEALATAAVRVESAALRDLAVGTSREFLGSSPAALEVAAIIGKLAASDTTALIVGESGTGKTFVARLIHEASSRASSALRVINCAAIPEALVESELFGAERGAYSGAVATRIGAFEAVGDGTLFLDEIGELSPASQAKLLRAIEERRFERVGSNRPLELRARILAATNRDLRAMADAGTFRQDLYFRIGVITLAVPPLRDRGDDVLTLADRMLADLATRRVTGFSDDARAALLRYAWPGNARELRNAIEHALVLGDDPRIGLADLPELVRRAGAAAAASPAPASDGTTTITLPADLRWLEERAIEAALSVTGGNRTKAAAILGINRVTLQKKLAK